MSTTVESLHSPKLFWAFWGGVAAVWQYRSLKTHNGATGSETTRALLRVHTRPGRWAFIIGYALFTAWFPKHILKPVGKAIMAVSGTEDQHGD